MLSAECCLKSAGRLGRILCTYVTHEVNDEVMSDRRDQASERLRRVICALVSEKRDILLLRRSMGCSGSSSRVQLCCDRGGCPECSSRPRSKVGRSERGQENGHLHCLGRHRTFPLLDDSRRLERSLTYPSRRCVTLVSIVRE